MKRIIVHIFVVIGLFILIIAGAAYIEQVKPQDELEEYLYLAKGKLTRKFAFGFNGEYADILWTLSLQSFHKGMTKGGTYFYQDAIGTNIKDIDDLASRLRKAEDPLSKYLNKNLSPSARVLIDHYDNPKQFVAYFQKNPGSRNLHLHYSGQLNILINRYIRGEEFHKTLEGEDKEIFSFPVEHADQENIRKNNKKLRALLSQHGYKVGGRMTINTVEQKKQWQLLDGPRTYFLKKKGKSIAVCIRKPPLKNFYHRKFRNSFMEYREALEIELKNKLREQLLQTMVQEMNNFLDREDLYNAERFSQVIIPEDLMDMIKERPTGKKSARVNRLLFETAYPHAVSRSPYFKNIEEVFDLITDLDPYFKGVYEKAPTFLLIAKDPTTALRMLEKGSRKEEIKDMPWIWLYLAQLHLSERFYLSKIREDDFKDISGFIKKIRQAKEPISRHLRSQMASNTIKLLTLYDGSEESTKKVKAQLIIELNRVIQGVFLYDKKLFAGIDLSTFLTREIRIIDESKMKGIRVMHANRLLLEVAYPEFLEKVEEKNTLLGLKALKKSIDLGAGPKIKDIYISIARYDRWAVYDIVELVNKFEKARKNQEKEIINNYILPRLHDLIAKEHLKTIENQIKIFQKKFNRWPNNLQEMKVTLPYEPNKDALVFIAEDLSQLKNQGKSTYDQLTIKFSNYLNNMQRLKHMQEYLNPYIYDKNDGKIYSYHLEMLRVKGLLSQANLELDRFINTYKRYPADEEFSLMLKKFPKLPLGKKYVYQNGRIDAQ